MQKLILILILLNTYAFAGRDGNGGNEIALRFTQIAIQSLEYLERPGKNPENIDLIQLKSAIKNTEVYSVTYKLCADDSDKSCPNEAGFVAKNYPERKEIYVNAQKWNDLSLDEKIRIVLHEYLGIIGLEVANYRISSNIVIALSAKQGEHYSCNLSLIKNTYPYKVLGSAGFLVGNGNVNSMIASSPIQYSKNDVVFRMVSAENYLRGTVEISEIDRENPHFIMVERRNEIIFENETFFDGEPVGVKVFQRGDKLLQISCVHI